MSPIKRLTGLWKKLSKGNKVCGASLACILFSGMVYQNCSTPSDSTGNSLASLGAKMDFPYDGQLDQIAYMSCNQLAQGTYDTSAYFGFRAGAYRTGSGIQTTPAFNSNINVSGGQASNQAALLSQIAAVQGARPQLAVRSFANFQLPFLSQNTSSGTEGRDYSTFFTLMDNPDFAMAAITVSPGDGVKYVRTEGAEGARLETSIALNDTWGTVTSLQRSITSGSLLLALTYIGQTGGYQARAPSDYNVSKTASGISAYGRGYQLQFRQPIGSSGGYPISTLSSVSEISLQTRGVPPTPGGWTCDPAMQFRILRNNLISDISLAGCTISVDNPSDAKLKIVRNSFKVEDWYVDMANRCLIPKKVGGGCYASSVGIPANTPPTVVGGTVYPNDFLNYNIASAASAPGSNNNIFVEFGSICYR